MSELKATPGPWSVFNMVNAETGKRMTPEEIGEYVANAVRARPECDDFLFISALVDGEPRDVCHIGNGEAGPYNALLMAASHDLYESLNQIVRDEEQSVFEIWLADNAPSGGVESVEAQWKMSAAYLDFADEWELALGALAKARGEP